MDCPFCTPQEVIFSNEYAYARFDRFPVTNGHILVIPYRHEVLYFDLTKEEQLAILDLIGQAKDYLEQEFKPDGYNLGINVGEASGQTIMHVHCHVIPRYKGDLADPRGGIRAVIPEKKLY